MTAGRAWSLEGVFYHIWISNAKHQIEEKRNQMSEIIRIQHVTPSSCADSAGEGSSTRNEQLYNSIRLSSAVVSCDDVLSDGSCDLPVAFNSNHVSILTQHDCTVQS